MNAPSLSASLAIAALIGSAALPALAQDGHATYRERVLGERVAAAAPSTATGAEQRLVPGPHGRYLVHLGRSPEQAIAEARAGGEAPVWATRPVAQTHAVDGFAAYQRYLGHAGRSADSVATDVAHHAAATPR